MSQQIDGPTALMQVMYNTTGVGGSVRFGYEVAGLSRAPGYSVIEFNSEGMPKNFNWSNMTRMVDEINHMFGPGHARLAKPEDYANPALLEGKIGIVVPDRMLERGGAHAINNMRRETVEFWRSGPSETPSRRDSPAWPASPAPNP